MTSVLVRQCGVVATMDDADPEIVGGSILIEDGTIVWVGDHPLPPEAGNHQLLPGSAGDIEMVDGRGW